LGRLIICAQTNWRAISYDADRMAETFRDVGAPAAQGRSDA
jgi:hypothetical protein